MATKSTKKAASKKAAKSTMKTPAKSAAKPKAPAKAKPAPATADAPAPVRERDPRLPRPGTILRRTYQGKEYEVQVLDAGFLHDGKTWRSLSGIAKAITGTAWNGFTFWGTQRRVPKTPAQTTEAK